MRHLRLVLALTVLCLQGCPGGADDRNAGAPDGRTPHTSPAPLPLASSPVWEAPHLTTTEINARRLKGEDLLMVDVRSEDAWKKEHIEGAVSLPWADLDKKHATLPKDRPIVLYCA